MQPDFRAQAEVGSLIAPDRPLSQNTVRALHDKFHGPKDSYGRRLWPAELIERIREARAARSTKAA